jgi:hypothetical protein
MENAHENQLACTFVGRSAAHVEPVAFKDPEGSNVA